MAGAKGKLRERLEVLTTSANRAIKVSLVKKRTPSTVVLLYALHRLIHSSFDVLAPIFSWSARYVLSQFLPYSC